MATEIEPSELARLVDFAERPRVNDWSLRSALVRYAQPQPERASAILEIVRRLDWALSKAKLERNGPAMWAAYVAGDDSSEVGLLRAAADVDELGDVLATWAVNPSGDRPDAAVDTAVGTLGGRLDELGVPREDPIPRGVRSRG